MKDIFESTLMSTNELSQITGLSTSYIASVKKGAIKSINKDNLIYMAVALNLPFDRINELINRYGHGNLSINDIDIFLRAAKRRNILGLQALYDNIGFSLLLLSLEMLPGNEYVVSDRITNKLQPRKYSTFLNIRRGFEDSVYLKLAEKCASMRRQLFYKTIRNFNVYHLICEDCLKEYIARCKDNNEEKKFIINHFMQFFKYIQGSNYHIKLLKRCPYFRFEMKEHKVFFIGQDSKHRIKRTGSRLYGFATDSKKIYQYFEREFKELSRPENLSKEFAYPAEIISHIKDLFMNVAQIDLGPVRVSVSNKKGGYIPDIEI